MMTVIGFIDPTMTTIQIEEDGVSSSVPNDIRNTHRQAIADWEAEGNTIPPYAAPPPPTPDQISDRQFFQELSIMGLITQAEALSAVQVGTIPAAMETFIGSLPSAQQFSARMVLTGATTFQRSHPLVAMFGAAQGMTSAQIDALWIAASAL
jgi:hypothetical protein